MTEKTFIDLYQRQKDSGFAVKEFCRNEGVVPSTFYYWKKKLLEKNRLPGFIPVVVNSTASIPRVQSQDSSVLHETTTPDFEIEFPNKTILRIKGELDISVLKTLIHLTD